MTTPQVAYNRYHSRNHRIYRKKFYMKNEAPYAEVGRREVKNE